MFDKKIFLFLVVFGLVIVLAGSVFSVDDLIALQGNVKQGGVDLGSGDLVASIYDSYSGGNLIYNSTTDFNGAIAGGKYDVLLGNGSNELSLEYGKFYYLELYVDNEIFTFNGSTRQLFQSGVGQINATSINSNQINSSHLELNIDLGNATNIQASAVNKSTGTNWLGQMLDGILDSIYNMFTGVNTTANIQSLGFYNTTQIDSFNSSWSSITNSSYGAKADYQFTNNNFNGSGNMSASYFFGDGSQLTGITSSGSSAWSSNASTIWNSSVSYVGIGTGSPSVPLDVRSTGASGNVQTAQFANTAGGAPYIRIGDTSGTGVNALHLGIQNADNTAGFISLAGQTESALLNLKGSNVGIGTAIPQKTLEVVGEVRVRNSGNNAKFSLNSTDSANNQVWEWQAYESSLGSGLNLNSLKDTGAVTNVIYFDPSGSVGIGTDSPTQELEVSGDVNITGVYYGDGSQLTGVIASSTAWNRSGTNIFQANLGDSVGIGTASPSTNLEISGTSNPNLGIIDSTSDASWLMFQAWDGDTSGPVIGWGDANAATPRDLRFISYTGYPTTGSSVKMTLEGDTGNLGIGTTSPSSLLHLKGSTSQMRIENTADGVAGYIGDKNALTGAGADDLVVRAENDLQFASGGNNQRMTIDSSGNVGIGTPTPPRKFSINGTGNLKAEINIEEGSGNASSWIVAGDGNLKGFLTYISPEWTALGSRAGQVEVGAHTGLNLTLFADGSEKMRLDTDGNLGIGTTSPSANLDFGNTINEKVLKRFEDGSTVAWTNEVVSGEFRNILEQDTPTVSFIWGERNWNAAAASAITEWMRIDSSGNVGIGTTSPTQELEVSGDVNITGVYYGDGSGLTGITASSTSWNRSGTNIFQANLGDNVGIGTTSPGGKLEITENVSGASDIFVLSNINTENVVDSAPNVLFQVKDTVGTTKGVGRIRFTDASSNWAGSAMIFQTQNPTGSTMTDALTIDENQNVGIGTTSPLNKLSVDGDINSTGDVIVGLNDQLVIDRANRASHGRIEYKNASALQWTTGLQANLDSTTFAIREVSGTDVLVLTKAGNVGIGTDSPTTALEVDDGGAVINLGDVIGNSGFPGITLSEATPSSTNYNIIGDSANTYLNRESGFIAFRLANSDQMTLTAGGFLGIGTTTSYNAAGVNSGLVVTNTTGTHAGITIAVQDSSTDDSYLVFANGTATLDSINGYLRYSHDQDQLDIFTGANTNTMTLDKNNRVGIGTSSPGFTLDVDSTDNRVAKMAHNTATTTNAQSLYIVQSGTGDSKMGFEISGVTGWDIGIDNSDSDKFKISHTTGVGNFDGASEQVTIDTSGSVGIGTTTPRSTYGLSIESTGAWAGMQFNATSGTDQQFLIQAESGASGNGAGFAIYDATDGAYRMFIDDSGDVGIGTASPSNKLDVVQTADDDIKLKIDVDVGSRAARFHMDGSLAGYNELISSTSETQEWKIGSGAAAGTMTFHTGASGVERMRISSAGRVGIGTTSPKTTINTVGSFNMTNGTRQVYHNDTCVILTGDTSTLSIC